MTEVKCDGFGKYEGYISGKEAFNGVIFCLREQNTNYEKENEFWFQKVLADGEQYHQNLRDQGVCEQFIRKSKSAATKFRRRFIGILSQLTVQLGVENDLTKAAFCNVNPNGGGNSVSRKSGYKSALENASEKLETIVSHMNQNPIVICTCGDVYEKLKVCWGAKRKVTEEQGGIEYNNGEKYPRFQCEIGGKDVWVYKIMHLSRSRRVRGEEEC